MSLRSAEVLRLLKGHDDGSQRLAAAAQSQS